MATAAQATATTATFLSFISSSPHHTTPSSFASFLAGHVLPTSLRASSAGSPTFGSRCQGRSVTAIVAQLRWSSQAMRSFAMVELEARKMRYPTTGTKGLLMGILVEGISDAAKLLRANEITLLKVHEEAEMNNSWLLVNVVSDIVELQ
ncbi:hypothetical protein ABZP36_005267 [Zizania latifolia]